MYPQYPHYPHYPQATYLIFATARSGSYLLCEALTNTGLAGQPLEYFSSASVTSVQSAFGRTHFKIMGFAEYLDLIMTKSTSPNGVFGAKIIWQFFGEFLDEARTLSGYRNMPVCELMSAIFPGVRYIWITRRDKVRQAVSYWKALKSGVWANIDGDTVMDWTVRKPRVPAFDFRGIDLLLRGAIQDEAEMGRFFQTCGVEPLSIVYEDFIAGYAETVMRMLEYLEIPAPTSLTIQAPKMRPLSDAQSDHWVERYQQCKQEYDTRYGPRHKWPRYAIDLTIAHGHRGQVEQR